MAKSINIPTGVPLNATTSTKILDARPGRLGIVLSIETGTVFVKEQAAGVDNDKKGIVLVGPTVRPIGNSGNVMFYNGEVCAIASTGTPTIYVVEIY